MKRKVRDKCQAYISTYEHLKNYCRSFDYTLEEIDDTFLEGFKQYLYLNVSRRGEGKLNPNTAQSYFNKVKAALREAFMKKMIKENPCNRIKGIKGQESHRSYLTLEELQKLTNTSCDNELLKKAFLFSCLTGLRWSDVKQVTWNKLKHCNINGWSLHFTQQKTKTNEVLPIAEQAIKLLEDVKPNTEDNKDKPIFESLQYNTWMNDQLQKWINRAKLYSVSSHDVIISSVL